MNDRDQAIQALTEAEATLQGLIEQALSENRYSDVAAVAKIADALALLVRSIQERRPYRTRRSKTTQAPEAAPGQAGSAEAQARSSDNGQSASRSKKYPFFERDDDRLVKVGWSKKDRSTYEHRAPQEVVFLFAHTVQAKANNGQTFTMEEILPLKDYKDEEIPSYQAYLALAWLRDVGVIQRRGKDGYEANNGALTQEKLEVFWNAVPARQ